MDSAVTLALAMRDNPPPLCKVWGDSLCRVLRNVPFHHITNPNPKPKPKPRRAARGRGGDLRILASPATQRTVRAGGRWRVTTGAGRRSGRGGEAGRGAAGG